MSSDQPPGGSAVSPPKASLIGEVLDGRYRITKMLGEGGMGEVYAADHVHIDKRFAVKLLRPEIVSNPEAVTRFRQEARSASSIGHRNIIGIEDFGQLPDGRIYMCMELLQGAPLNDMIQQPMSVDRLLNIMIQTGHGLAAAHNKGIVHRDMKPENIYVTVGPNGEDVPKLLDFGIAKVAGNDGQNNLTRTGTIFGTPFYMAPEQALGQGVDARADIYAMGIIMYEVFAGSLPFQGESFMGILTQHITTEAEPVAQRAGKAGRQLPGGLPEIISRCMQKDPARRFTTMDELVAALVEVYRTVSGAGMSAFMAPFPVARTGSQGSQPSMPGTPQGSIPTMMGAPAARVTPPPMAPGSGPQAPYAGYGSQAAPAAAVTGAITGGSMAAASQVSQASDSLSVPARGSKAPLIIMLLVLLLGGGGAAAYFLVFAKKAPTPVAQIADAGSGSGSAALGSAGSAVIPTAGSGSAIGSDAGSAAGSAIAAIVIDAGVPAVVIDAAPAPKPDAAPIAPTPVNVMVKISPANAKIFNGAALLDKGATMLSVVPGTPITLIAKASGYKDQPIVVDGSTQKIEIKLEKEASTGGTGTKPPDGGTGTKPPDDAPKCSSSGADFKSMTPACKKKYCAGHPDDFKHCAE